jgi:hypothetical protein
VKGIYADQVFNTLNNILITLSWKHDLVFFFSGLMAQSILISLIDPILSLNIC